MSLPCHDYLTVVAISGHNDGAATLPSLSHSLRELPGARGLLVSPQQPANLPAHIRWAAIQAMTYRQYSLFVMYCLAHFIETEYALIVQEDSWVLDGRNWRSEFLHYDYIGAPCHAALVKDIIFMHYSWTDQPDPIIIQNGGFSLRSRKLLLAPAQHGVMYNFHDAQPIPNEDVQLSGLFRRKLEGLGLRFAPDDLAKTFSIEYLGAGFHDDLDFGRLFGIHGQSRKLVAEKQVKCSHTRADTAKSHRENEVMAHLESLGYHIEYATPKYGRVY